MRHVWVLRNGVVVRSGHFKEDRSLALAGVRLMHSQRAIDNGAMPISELRSIATFATTAELGSLRRAAEPQGMTPQAASQADSQLEQHLGVRLFHRTTRGMSLTDEDASFSRPRCVRSRGSNALSK